MARPFPKDLLRLIGFLKRLPGVGSRTAERFAFELLSWEEDSLKNFGETLTHLKESVISCPTCGCLADQHSCRLCSNRDPSSLCLVASPRDVYAIEEMGTYRGLYHVIEHLLSPFDEECASTIQLDRIEKKLAEHPIREVIIAFDSTLEGDTTALYLKSSLERPNLSISRLAFGIPVGSSLEQIDSGTLSRAFSGRHSI